MERIIYEEETSIAIHLNGYAIFRLKFDNISFYEIYRVGPLSEILEGICPAYFMNPNYEFEESAEEELHDIDEMDNISVKQQQKIIRSRGLGHRPVLRPAHLLCRQVPELLPPRMPSPLMKCLRC